VKPDSCEIFLYSGVKNGTIFQPKKQEHFFVFLQEFLKILRIPEESYTLLYFTKKILFKHRKMQPSCIPPPYYTSKWCLGNFSCGGWAYGCTHTIAIIIRHFSYLRRLDKTLGDGSLQTMPLHYG